MAERKDGRSRTWITARLAPSEKPCALDIAWAAGVYEGEGTCAAPRHSRPSLSVLIVQKDIWLLEKLKRLFGGSVYYRKSYALHLSPCSVWALTGPRARGFAYTIYTYLSPRRRVQLRKALGV
jgi:hypothetical protein